MAIDKDFLDKVYNKQEVISMDVNEIKVVLGKQEENLRLHMYRTELAEQNIELLREQVTPIEKHVYLMHAILKVVGGLVVFTTLIISILKIVQYLVDGSIS